MIKRLIIAGIASYLVGVTAMIWHQVQLPAPPLPPLAAAAVEEIKELESVADLYPGWPPVPFVPQPCLDPVLAPATPAADVPLPRRKPDEIGSRKPRRPLLPIPVPFVDN